MVALPVVALAVLARTSFGLHREGDRNHEAIQLDAIACAGFLGDATMKVALNRLVADSQAIGDLLVGQFSQCEFRNLGFSRRKPNLLDDGLPVFIRQRKLWGISEDVGGMVGINGFVG